MLGSNTLEHLLLKLINNNKFDPNILNSFIKKLKSYQINWNTIKDQNTKDLSWSIVRIALIIILSQSNYDLIILDEPTFGLGYQQKRKLSELLDNILVNILHCKIHDIYLTLIHIRRCRLRGNSKSRRTPYH